MFSHKRIAWSLSRWICESTWSRIQLLCKVGTLLENFTDDSCAHLNNIYNKGRDISRHFKAKIILILSLSERVLSLFLCSACTANWEKRKQGNLSGQGLQVFQMFLLLNLSHLGVSSPLIPRRSVSLYPLPRLVAYCSLKSLCDRRHHSVLLWQPPRRAPPPPPPPLPISPPSPSRPSFPLLFPCHHGSAHTRHAGPLTAIASAAPGQGPPHTQKHTPPLEFST